MSAGAAPPWIESQLPVRGELALADILRVLEPQVRGVSFRIVSIVGAAGYPPEEMAAAVAEGRLLTAEELAAGAPARGYVEWMTVVGAYDRAVLSGRPTIEDAVARADLLLFSNDGDPWTLWTRDPVAARAVALLGGPEATASRLDGRRSSSPLGLRCDVVVRGNGRAGRSNRVCLTPSVTSRPRVARSACVGVASRPGGPLTGSV